MTRQEAFSPLLPSEGRFIIAHAGFLSRASIRRAAAIFFVQYYEEKSWFSSTFVFRGEALRIREFYDFLNTIYK